MKIAYLDARARTSVVIIPLIFQTGRKKYGG